VTVFAAIATGANEGLRASVESRYPGANHYKVAPGQYLVYAPGLTSKQVSDQLGITGGEGGLGRVVVFRVTAYAGWHARDMWEWIDSHMSESPPRAQSANE
jgi:hypothetical protein